MSCYFTTGRFVAVKLAVVIDPFSIPTDVVLLAIVRETLICQRAGASAMGEMEIYGHLLAYDLLQVVLDDTKILEMWRARNNVQDPLLDCSETTALSGDRQPNPTQSKRKC